MHQLTSSVSVFPYAVNDAGQIAGLGQYRGFFYSEGELIPLGTLSRVPNGNRSTARSLNSQGQVVGWSTVGSEPERKLGPLATHAFLWQRRGQSGRMRDLGTLPGWVNSYACSIDDKGEVVGAATDVSGTPYGLEYGLEGVARSQAFLWRSGKMTALPNLPGGSSAAFGVNNSAEVAGSCGGRAVLWRQGKITDLNTCLPSSSGWTLEEARAINNKGQIIGTGTLNGQAHMFLLTPSAHS